jgi:hypothetical protein
MPLVTGSSVFDRMRDITIIRYDIEVPVKTAPAVGNAVPPKIVFPAET